ncbi:hypothetical protein AB6A23_27155 [Paenibacillus tarimensis]
MDQSDNDLLQDLKNEPFVRNGFNHRLQQKILDKADHIERSKPRKPHLAWMGSVFAVALTCMILLLYGLNGNGSHDALDANQLASPSSHPSAYEGFHNGTNAGIEFQSAVLVGLRTDYPAEADKAAYSEYRTVLVAPEDGELVQAAEGQGILMPYKMDFWMIEPKTRTKKNKEVQILSASLASPPEDATPSGKNTAEESASVPELVKIASDRSETEKAPNPEVPDAVDSLGSMSLDYEKLLFAGNRNIAVQQEVTSDSEYGASPLTFMWVKHIEQLRMARQDPFNPKTEPHVAIQGAIPTWSADTENGLYRSYYNNWTIVRKPGRWVAQEAVQSPLSSSMRHYTLRDVLVKLPEEVASFDKLSVSWEEIWRREPEALDAFSSPKSEMVAIVTGETISFYLNGGGLAAEPALQIMLQPAETIVMMQWATHNYVDRWKRQVRQLIGPFHN